MGIETGTDGDGRDAPVPERGTHDESNLHGCTERRFGAADGGDGSESADDNDGDADAGPVDEYGEDNEDDNDGVDAGDDEGADEGAAEAAEGGREGVEGQDERPEAR